MTDSIHGHAVMEMMLEANTQFSRESLKQAIEAKFGVGTKFHTCSASDMDANALIEFLAARGKFVETDAGFNTAKEKICNH
ncbi:YecH family protein [Neiella marina]|uniref:YecH family protein n=1 Tax=Neiella holothuriorum TaxID=2870530 RepID=A0ABS7EH77_9GAMM|nr:YecH family metal-binding protein [Neiella holothuriorum]MBW8191579.1 YecH family protein [Neiella holothuriorum]